MVTRNPMAPVSSGASRAATRTVLIERDGLVALGPGVDEEDDGGTVDGTVEDAGEWRTADTTLGGVLKACDGPPQAVSKRSMASAAPRRGVMAVTSFANVSKSPSRLPDLCQHESFSVGVSWPSMPQVLRQWLLFRRIGRPARARPTGRGSRAYGLPPWSVTMADRQSRQSP